jgi:hypothetical protein
MLPYPGAATHSLYHSARLAGLIIIREAKTNNARINLRPTRTKPEVCAGRAILGRPRATVASGAAHAARNIIVIIAIYPPALVHPAAAYATAAREWARGVRRRYLSLAR